MQTVGALSNTLRNCPTELETENEPKRLVAEVPDELTVSFTCPQGKTLPLLHVGGEIEVPIGGTRVIQALTVQWVSTLIGSEVVYILLLVPPEVYTVKRDEVVELLADLDELG